MTDCVCGRPEGTNDDCERCDLTARNAQLLAALMAVSTAYTCTGKFNEAMPKVFAAIKAAEGEWHE